MKNAKILLVEDDPAQITLGLVAIKKLNDQNPGSQIVVDVVRDGAAAIEAMSNHRYGLVLLDLRMPRMDGFEVLGEVKTNPELRRVPIVVLTTSDLDADIEQALGLYANAYLVKPLNQKKLMAVLENIKNFWTSSEIRT